MWIQSDWHNKYVEIPCDEVTKDRIRDHFINIGLPIYVTRPNSNITANLKRSLKWRSMLSISQMSVKGGTRCFSTKCT